MSILAEIGLVFVLVILNGFFSGAEMAIISMRKTRIKELVKAGNKQAMIIDDFKKSPEQFLAIIQIGITLVSTIASVFAGANIADALTPVLEQTSWPFLSDHAAGISFVLIVVGITYLSIVFGELVPKSLGIKFAEKFALFVAYPLYFLSKIIVVITRILTASSNLILKIFGDQTSFSEAKLTQEELRSILYESHKAGTIAKQEHEILDNVFDFADIAVDQIMTPRSKIFAIDLDDPVNKNIQAIVSSGYSRIPVYKGKIDNVVGILNVKNLLPELQGRHNPIQLARKITKPCFIPNTQRIGALLRLFQKGKIHLAIVTDEHGDVDGLITIEDILEEIVGDIRDESDDENKQVYRQKDGSYLVEGTLNIVDFNKFFKTALPEDEQYTTISGLLLEKFEKFPEVGTEIEIENFEFTVKAKTERTIETVSVKKIRK